MNPALYRVPAWHKRFYRLRWHDAEAVHHRVMGLFPENLSRGDGAGPRAAAHVLYRLELQAAKPYVLVQSDVPPVDDGLERRPMASFFALLEPGRKVGFRIDVNAVRMKSRTRRLEPVPLAEVPQWAATTRLATGLRQIEVGVPGDFEVRRGKGGTPVRVVRLDGRAVVSDGDLARDLVRRGVGRARSYGCGLLSIAPGS